MLYALVVLVSYPLALAGVVVYATNVIRRDQRRIYERFGGKLGEQMAAQYGQNVQQLMAGKLLRPAAFWGTILAITGCVIVRALS